MKFVECHFGHHGFYLSRLRLILITMTTTSTFRLVNFVIAFETVCCINGYTLDRFKKFSMLGFSNSIYFLSILNSRSHNNFTLIKPYWKFKNKKNVTEVFVLTIVWIGEYLHLFVQLKEEKIPANEANPVEPEIDNFEM